MLSEVCYYCFVYSVQHFLFFFLGGGFPLHLFTCGGSSTIYCTSTRLFSLKIKCWPWQDKNWSFRDRLFHHSEMERSRYHNTAIKFHQASLHAEFASSPMHYTVSPSKYHSRYRCITGWWCCLFVEVATAEGNNKSQKVQKLLLYVTFQMQLLHPQFII